VQTRTPTTQIHHQPRRRRHPQWKSRRPLGRRRRPTARGRGTVTAPRAPIMPRTRISISTCLTTILIMSPARSPVLRRTRMLHQQLHRQQAPRQGSRPMHQHHHHPSRKVAAAHQENRCRVRASKVLLPRTPPRSRAKAHQQLHHPQLTARPVGRAKEKSARRPTLRRPAARRLRLGLLVRRGRQRCRSAWLATAWAATGACTRATQRVTCSPLRSARAGRRRTAR